MMFGTRRDTQTIRPQPKIIRDGTPAYRAHLVPAILEAGHEPRTLNLNSVWPDGRELR